MLKTLFISFLLALLLPSFSFAQESELTPVTSGNLIVVGVTVWNTTIPGNAVTDNKGNTYTKAVESINAGTTDHAAIFYAKNVTGGSSFTVTSSVGGTISTHEYSGADQTSPLDKTASSTGTSATPSSGNVTTVTNNELYFGLAPGAKEREAPPQEAVTLSASKKRTTIHTNATPPRTKLARLKPPPRLFRLPQATPGRERWRRSSRRAGEEVEVLPSATSLPIA